MKSAADIFRRPSLNISSRNAAIIVLGSGHHLHSAEGGICLLGGDPRWVLSQSSGLGSGSNFGNATDDRGAGASHRESTTRTCPGASLPSSIASQLVGKREKARAPPVVSRHELVSKL